MSDKVYGEHICPRCGQSVPCTIDGHRMHNSICKDLDKEVEGVRHLYESFEQEVNEDGTLKHIIKENSTRHVLWYDSHGEHCSEPDCEINKHLK